MAEKKVWSQRAYRVAIRRQSFSLECIFNKMPLLIQRVVKGKCFISDFPGRYADCHPSGFQRFTQPRCVIASVCQKRTVVVGGGGAGGWLHPCSRRPVLQSAKQDRTPMPVTNDMEFGIQAAFCSSYKTWRIPFLSRLAAVR